MIDISLIVLIIFVISTLLGIYKLIKLGLTIAGLFSLAISIALLLAGIALYLDVREFSGKFESSPKLFLLQENETILSGFSGVLGKQKEELHFLTEEEVATLQQAYEIKDYKTMKADNYKLFLVTMRAFTNASELIITDEGTYTKDYFSSLLRSSTPLDDFAESIISEENISLDGHATIKQDVIDELKKTSPTDTEFKASLFGVLLTHATKEQGAFFILQEFQKGNIVIYPESALFKLVKYVPPQYLQQIIREEQMTNNSAAPST